MTEPTPTNSTDPGSPGIARRAGRSPADASGTAIRSRRGVRARTARGLGLGAALIALAAVASCRASAPGSGDSNPEPAAAPRSRADEPNTTHGVYTVAQAERGRAVHDRICSECHDSAEWTEPGFKDRWRELSVYRLWHWIYQRMPHGNPGTLSREQVTDALTYILQLNGLPAGNRELGTDDDSIDDYWIVWGES